MEGPCQNVYVSSGLSSFFKSRSAMLSLRSASPCLVEDVRLALCVRACGGFSVLFWSGPDALLRSFSAAVAGRRGVTSPRQKLHPGANQERG